MTVMTEIVALLHQNDVKALFILEVNRLDRLTKEDCINILKTKAAQLVRLPKKDDFSQNEVAFIKSYFGPWPRALEAAGLKPSSGIKTTQKTTDK